MSTTESTTAKWDSAGELTRSESALISSHWGEIVRYLAPPTAMWRWGECRISHRVKYRWKNAGLIERAPDRQRWQTTETLWVAVIERAADDESVGEEATGQELLTLDALEDRESVYLVDRTTRSWPDVQETLSGDTVRAALLNQVRSEGLAARNRSKDPTAGDERGRDAAQTRLQTAHLYNTGEWDVIADSDAGIAL